MPTPTKFVHKQTGAPTGDVIDLGDWYSQVQVTARGACLVRQLLQAPGSAAPSAPNATPVPSAGAESAPGWVDLVANDVVNFDPDPTGQTLHRYIPIWETTANALVNIEAK